MDQAHRREDEDDHKAEHASHRIGDGDVLQALLHIQVEELADHPETGVGHMVEDQGACTDGQGGGDGLQAQHVHHRSHNAHSSDAGGGHGTNRGSAGRARRSPE